MFNKEELTNIHALIIRADLNGGEATTVAILLNKIEGLINAEQTGTGELVQPERPVGIPDEPTRPDEKGEDTVSSEKEV